MPKLTLSSNLKSRKQLKQTSSAVVECEPEKRNEKVNFGERLMSVCARDRGAILFGLLYKRSAPHQRVKDQQGVTARAHHPSLY